MSERETYLFIGPPEFLEEVAGALGDMGSGPSECIFLEKLAVEKAAFAAKRISRLVVHEHAALSGQADCVADLMRGEPGLKALFLLNPNLPGTLRSPDLESFGPRARMRRLTGESAEAVKETLLFLGWKAGADSMKPDLPLSEMKVRYEKDGVHLFIDPAKYRRVTFSSDEIDSQTLSRLNANIEAALTALNKLKIKDLDLEAVRFVVSHNVNRPVKIAPPQRPVRDARFDLRLEESRLFASVTPPTKGGARLEKETVLKKARAAIENRDWLFHEEELEKALARVDGGPAEFLLAERRDGAFSIEIASDKLAAYLTLERAYDGKSPEPEDALAELARIGATHGLNERVLRNAFKHGVYGEKIAAAQGTPPEQGENGWYEILWEEKDFDAAGMEVGGKIDFRKISLLTSVEKGEPLAAVHPPKAGKPGVDVFGREIPARDGEPVLMLPHNPALKGVDDNTLFYGEGCAPNRDQSGLVSLRGGAPEFVDGAVSVFPRFEIPGNVDFSTGNIAFDGNVVVHGNVLSRFRIKAGGNIIVHGIVEDAILEAGADIILHSGVSGAERAILFARGSVVAKNIHTANVFAIGRIVVEEAVYHSRLVSCQEIAIGGDSDLGHIIGGAAKAARCIDAAEIGGVNHTRTRVEIGKNPFIQREMEALRAAFVNSRHVASKAHELEKLLRREHGGFKENAAEEKAREPERTEEAAFHDAFIEWIDDFQSGDLEKLSPPEIEWRDRYLKVIGRVKIHPGVTAVVRSDVIPVSDLLKSCCLTPDGVEPYDKGVKKSMRKIKRPSGDPKRTKLGYRKGERISVEEET